MEFENKERISKNKDFAYVFFLVIIFLGFRFFNLNQQSVWFDEYVVIGNAKICSLKEFFYLLYTNSPDYGVSPVSSVIFYLWINLFPNTETVWRVLPVLFGLFSLLLFYSYFRRLFGRREVFLASLLFSLSPFNIWFHQELKCYAFLQFLGLASYIFLFNLIFSSKFSSRWLCLFFNALFNGIMPWFHLTYITVPLFQGMILLIFYKFTSWRVKFIWAFITFLCLIPWLIWCVYTLPYLYNLIDVEASSINIWDLFLKVFANDSVGFSEDLIPAWKYNIVKVFGIEKIFLKSVFYCDYLVLGTISAFLLLFVMKNLVFGWMGKSCKTKPYIGIFWIVSFILPIVFFFILGAMVKRSAFHPLYFFYTLPIMYVLVSSGISIFRNSRRLYMVVIVLLVVGYLIQSLSLIRYVNRTNYKDAFAFLQKNVGLGDRVLGHRFITFWDVGKFYLKREDIDFRSYYSIEGLFSFIDDALKGENKLRLWIVVEPLTLYLLYKEDVVNLVTKNLMRRGIDVHWKHFPGHYNLYVGLLENRPNYKITNKGEYQDYVEEIKGVMWYGAGSGNMTSGRIKSQKNLSYQQLAKCLKIFLDNDEENSRRVKVLRYFISYWPLASWMYLFVLNELIVCEEYEIAEGICDYLLENNQNYATIYLLKGIVHHKKGEYVERDTSFEKCWSISALHKKLYKPLIDDLLSSHIEGRNRHYSNFIKRLSKSGCWPLGDMFLKALDGRIF
ncbi:MAG: glycosyltransferase family 39 protein [Candidatus Hydrogenedentes bacterium]|nr:glycosyltransferase family 39 protein [Candidatus Hydrogenedentota bacterium]